MDVVQISSSLGKSAARVALLRYQGLTAQSTEEEIYLDDLRPMDDPTLQYYPRMSTLAEAQALFKFGVNRSLGWDACPEGQACWKLIGVQIRTGIAAFIPLVVGPNALPDDQILVFLYWPGAPDLDPTAKPRYFEKAVGGWTDSNGVVGFAYGTGGLIGATGGPYANWVSAAPPGLQPQYSDALTNLGWLGGTDHFCPSGVWQYLVKGLTPPVPDPGTTPTGCTQATAAVLEAIAKALKGGTL